MTVDLAPLLQAVIGVGAIALSTVGTWAIARLGQKLGLQISQAQTARVDAAIDKAVQAGAVAAEQTAAVKGWDHPEVKSQIVGQALNYLIARFPDALKSAGLDPANADDAAKIRGAVQRALPAAVTPVAASPATTNGPAPAPAL